MSFLVLPISLAYFEIVNFVWTGLSANWFGAVFCAFAIGCILNVLCFVLKHNKWLVFALIEALAIFFLIEYFTNASYSVYMSPMAILKGASGVATEFGDAVVDVVKGGIPQILVMHVAPIFVLIMNLVGDKLNIKRSDAGVAVLLLSAIFCQSIGVQSSTNMNEPAYTYLYSYDNAVKNFGVGTAVKLDLAYAYTGVPAAPALEEQVAIETTGSAVTDVYNISDVNFEDYAQFTIQDLYKSMLTYVNHVQPTKKNDYTGLFEGKNLILIAAESLSKEVIREDVTPTLYRMATKGMLVEDFYQPFWGGSTTSGEASVLLGRIPTENTNSLNCIQDKDNSYSLAYKFRDAGYSAVALHPGEFDYYDRYITYPTYGFEKFIARGMGLEIPYTWPGDDLAAVQQTSDELLSKDPFFLYFMSYSGHGLYNFTGNEMAIKNKEFIDSLGLEGSPQLLGYYGATRQFDLALEYLCSELEARGELDDTVFIITGDHYPYALQKGDAWKNPEDHLVELFGYYVDGEMTRDHSTLVIWSPCLEDMDEQIVIDGPSYSVDIVPTIFNLFGIEYDSRLYPGRDLLSDSDPLAIWVSGSWKSEEGFYNSATGKFTPNDASAIVNQDYINKVTLDVSRRIDYSRQISNHNFFDFLKQSARSLEESLKGNVEGEQ